MSMIMMMMMMELVMMIPKVCLLLMGTMKIEVGKMLGETVPKEHQEIQKIVTAVAAVEYLTVPSLKL